MKPRDPKPASPAQLGALAARAPTFVLSDADRKRLVAAAREDAADSIVGTDAWRAQRAATVARERRALAAKLDELERLAAELGYTVIRGRKA